jgi:hypothetical protein
MCDTDSELCVDSGVFEATLNIIIKSLHSNYNVKDVCEQLKY